MDYANKRNFDPFSVCPYIHVALLEQYVVFSEWMNEWMNNIGLLLLLLIMLMMTIDDDDDNDDDNDDADDDDGADTMLSDAAKKCVGISSYFWGEFNP